jgi:DNA end-binding protein Ku
MATRGIWNGTISFGLVEIPISLHSAVTADRVDFDLLDRRDMSPIGYRKYNKRTEREVATEDIVRGVAVAKGEYVVLSEEEIKKTNPEATQTIDVVEFVDPDEIEPLFFEKPYYLKPQKRMTKSYALLRDVLERTGKVGIARIVMRTRQRLAAVTPHGPVLALTILRYADQIRDPADYEVPPARAADLKPSPAEIKLAERLVEEMSAEWDPGKYHDEFRNRLLDAVREKAEKGGTLRVDMPEAAPGKGGGKIIDLMALLKESVERKPPRRARAPAKGGRARLRRSG